MTERKDNSKIFSETVSFADVQTAERVVVRTTDGKKRFAGYKLVLRDKSGKELYSMSDSLGPPEARETLWQYLMRKHPMPKAPPNPRPFAVSAELHPSWLPSKIRNPMFQIHAIDEWKKRKAHSVDSSGDHYERLNGFWGGSGICTTM